MPAHRKITEEYRHLIAAVAYLRAVLPSDKELARDCGCSVRGVRSFRGTLDFSNLSHHGAIAALMAIESLMPVSRETSVGTIQQDGRSRPDRLPLSP